MNAIDTNILIYAVDTHETRKRVRANVLLRELSQRDEPLVIIWQVAVEFFACLRRWENDKRITREDTKLYLTEFLDILPMVFPTPTLLKLSLDLSTRYSLSHWDSLLIAACIDAGVQTLCSEDMDAGMQYGSVTVVDPFS